MMLGSPLWGIMADKFGRRPTLLCATFFLFWYGILTAISPSFTWVLILRFFVGMFIGCVPQVNKIEYMLLCKHTFPHIIHNEVNKLITSNITIKFQSCTLLVEYLPSGKRGKAVLIMALFWALGCLFEAVLAWMVMADYGWRFLIGLSSAPLLVFLFCSYWLPESPLYLATVGRTDDMALQIKRVKITFGIFYICLVI